MDQVRVKKTTVASTTVTNAAKGEQVKPMRQNPLLKPKTITYNPKVMAKLKINGRVSAVNVAEQKVQENQPAQKDVQNVKLDDKTFVEKTYGKNKANLVFKMAQKRLVPGVPKKMGKVGVAVQAQQQANAKVTSYTKKQLKLMSKLRPIAALPKKLTEKVVASYHQYLKLKGELMIASDNRKKAELRTVIEELETASPFLKNSLDAASFDDLKDAVLRQYQLSVTELLQTKNFDRTKLESIATNFVTLSANVSGLVDKVQKQQSSIEDLDGMTLKVDAKMAQVRASIANEDSAPKKKQLERELKDLETHKQMIQKMVDEHKTQLLTMNKFLEDITLARDKINSSITELVNKQTLDTSQVTKLVDTIGAMSNAMTKVSSVLVSEQTITLWANESALQFVSVWSTYQFLSDMKNMDDPQTRDYIIDARSKGLTELESTINEFVSSFAAATIDFTNLNKKYEQASQLSTRSQVLVNSLQSDIANLQQKITQLENQVLGNQQEIANNEKERRQVKIQIAKLKAKLRILETEIGIADRKQAVVQDTESTIDALKTQVSKLEGVAIRANAVLNQTSEPVLNALKASLMWKRIADEFAGTRNQLSDKVQEQMQQEIEANKKKEDEMKTRVANLQSEKDELLRKQAELLGDHKIDKEQLKVVAEQLAEIESKRSDAQKRVDQLTAELLLQGDKLSTAVAEQLLLKNQLNQKDEDLKKLADKRDHAEKVLQQVNKEKSQLEESIKKQQSEYEKKAKAEQENVDKLKQQIAQLDEQVSSADQLTVEKIERAKAELQADLELKMTAIETEKQLLQQQLNDLEKQKDEAIIKAKLEQQQEFEQEKHKLDQDALLLKNRIQELDNKLLVADEQTKVALKNQKAELQSKVDQKQVEIEQLKAQVQQRIDDAVKTATQKLDEEKQAVIADLNNRLTQAKNKEDQLRVEFDEELKRVRKEEAEKYEKQKKDEIERLTKLHDLDVERLETEAKLNQEKALQDAEQKYKQQVDEINLNNQADKQKALEQLAKVHQEQLAKLKEDAKRNIESAKEALQQQHASELDTIKSKHAQEVSKYQKQLAEQKSEAEKTLKELEISMQKQKEVIQSELKAAETRIASMVKDAQEIQQQMSVLQQEFDSAKAKWDAEKQALEKEIQSKQSIIDGQNKEIGAQRTQIEQLDGQVKLKDTQINNLTDQVKQVQSRLNTTEQELKTQTNLAQKLQTDVKNEQAKSQQLNAKVEQQSKELEENANLLKAAGKTIDEINASLATEKSNLQKMKQEYQQSVQREALLKRQLDVTSAQVKKAQEDIKDLTNQNEDLTKQVSTLKSKVAQQKTKISTLEGTVNTLREQLLQSDKKSAELQKQLNEEVKKLEQLKQAKEEVDKENKQLKDHVKEQDAKIAEQQAKLKRKDSEIAGLNSTIKKLENRISVLETENNSLKSKLDVEVLGREALEKLLNDGDKTNKKWDWKSIQNKVQSLFDDKSLLEQQKKDLELNKQQLTEQKSKYAGVLNKVLPLFGNKNLDQVSEQDIDDKIDDLWKELAPVLKKTDKKENLFAVLQRVALETQTQQKKISELEKELETRDQRIEELETNIEKEKTEWQKEKERLMSANQTLKSSNVKLSEELKKQKGLLEEEKQNRNKEKEEYIKAQKTLEAKNAQLQNDLNDAKTNLANAKTLDELIKKKTEAERVATLNSAKDMQQTLKSVVDKLKVSGNKDAYINKKVTAAKAELEQLITDLSGLSNVLTSDAQVVLESYLPAITKLTRDAKELSGAVAQWSQGYFYTEATVNELKEDLKRAETVNETLERTATVTKNDLDRAATVIKNVEKKGFLVTAKGDVTMSAQDAFTQRTASRLVFMSLAKEFLQLNDAVEIDADSGSKTEIAKQETIGLVENFSSIITGLASELLKTASTYRSTVFGPAHLNAVCRLITSRLANYMALNGSVPSADWLWSQASTDLDGMMATEKTNASILSEILALSRSIHNSSGIPTDFSDKLWAGNNNVNNFNLTKKNRTDIKNLVGKLIKARESKDKVEESDLKMKICEEYADVWQNPDTMQTMLTLLDEQLGQRFKSKVTLQELDEMENAILVELNPEVSHKKTHASIAQSRSKRTQKAPQPATKAPPKAAAKKKVAAKKNNNNDSDESEDSDDD